MKKPELHKALQVAASVSALGGQRALKYFDSKIEIQTKEDRTPVTKADRECEEIIRKGLIRNFPGHSIFGEEFGPGGLKNSEYKWWIDPIDGTLSFIRGLPFWGTVLGLEYKGEVLAGVLTFPALNFQIRAAKGLGCWMGKKRCRVSKISKKDQALFLYGGLRAHSDERLLKHRRFLEGSRDDRGWGDVFGHALVIQGKAEAMIDYVVQAYDVSGIRVCVEEAGGKFFNLKGTTSIHEGTAISCNPWWKDEILKNLQ